MVRQLSPFLWLKKHNHGPSRLCSIVVTNIMLLLRNGVPGSTDQVHSSISLCFLKVSGKPCALKTRAYFPFPYIFKALISHHNDLWNSSFQFSVKLIPNHSFFNLINFEDFPDIYYSMRKRTKRRSMQPDISQTSGISTSTKSKDNT